MKNFLRNIIKKIDIFGIHYVLLFDGKLKYQTILGGIVTIISIIFSASMIYVLGEEVFYKSNPKDLLKIEVNPKPMNLTYMKSMAFLIVDQTSSYLEDFKRLVRFQANYHQLSNINGTFTELQGFPKIINLRNCKSSDFPSTVSEQYYLMALDNAICFDNHDFTIGGDFSGDYVSYIDFWISPCLNYTNNNFKCNSKEEILEFFNSGKISISLHRDEIQYNATNFLNPIEKFIIEDNYILDMRISKKYAYYLQNFVVETNEGIFWNDFTSQVDQTYDIPKFDFSFNSNNFEEISLVEFRFLSSIKNVVHTRTYLKGTDVIAQLGGLLKIFLMVGEFLFYFIYHRRMNENIITKLFQVLEEDMNKQSSNNSENKPNPYSEAMSHLFIKSIVKKKISSYNVSSCNIIPSTASQLVFNKKREGKNLFKKHNELQNIVNIFPKNKPKPISQMVKVDLINQHFMKRFEREKLRLDKIFSKGEYIATTLLLCKYCYSKKIKIKHENYDRLVKTSMGYIDILKIVKNLQDFNKMKYVLFNKKQLAIFNLIEDPVYDHDDNKKRSKLTKTIKFEMNKMQLKEKAIEFLCEEESERDKNIISRRLYKLFGQPSQI
jgi:hypothetical protein